MSYWKFTFDAKSPTWTSYGRVLFVEAETEAEARAAASHLAQADFPQSEILPITIGESTPEAAQLFAVKKQRLAAWQENNRLSIPNDRSTLDPAIGKSDPASQPIGSARGSSSQPNNSIPDTRITARDWRPIATAPKGYNVWLRSHLKEQLADWGDFCLYNVPQFMEWRPIDPDPAPPGHEPGTAEGAETRDELAKWREWAANEADLFCTESNEELRAVISGNCNSEHDRALVLENSLYHADAEFARLSLQLQQAEESRATNARLLDELYPRLHEAEAKSERLSSQLAGLRTALTRLNGSLLQVDNGRCGICKEGYRSYDTKGNALVNCSNDECLSYVVAAALAVSQEPPPRTTEGV